MPPPGSRLPINNTPAKIEGTKNRLAVFFFSEEMRVVCTYLKRSETVLDPLRGLILTSI